MKGSLLFSSYPFISSKKVTLTRVTDMDLEALWQILGDEDSHRFTPEGALRSPRECAARLRQFDAMFRERRGVVLGIYSTLNRLVGLLEISQIDPQVECVTVSFILNPEFTGQGYASAALRATVDYLFRTVGVHRIQCYVLPINYRAVLVLERCGFVKEGDHSGGVPMAGQGHCGFDPVLPAALGPAAKKSRANLLSVTIAKRAAVQRTAALFFLAPLEDSGVFGFYWSKAPRI